MYDRWMLSFRTLYFTFLLLLYECRFACTQSTNANETKNIITLGVLLPWTGWPEGSKMASAATIAVEDVNNDPNLLKNYTLKFVWADDQCNNAASVGETAEFYYNFKSQNGRKGVDGYIGPYCSEGCIAAGAFAAYHDKPMISYSCSAVELSEKKNFPTFARTKTFARVNPSGLSRSLLSLMKRYKWRRITLIVSKEKAWHDFGQTIFRSLENLTNVEKISYDPLSQLNNGMSSTEVYKPMLKSAMKSSRSKCAFFLKNFWNLCKKFII